MADRYYLSESDRRVLVDEVLAAVRGRVGNTEQRPAIDPTDMLQTPDVYIALTPSGGIDAIDGDEPGSADCTVYRLIDGSLVALDFTRTVYNLTPWDIPEDEYILATRDKFGEWYATAADITSGWSLRNFVTLAECSTGSGAGTIINHRECVRVPLSNDCGDEGNCCTGECDDDGAQDTLTATITEKTGSTSAFPDSTTLVCVSSAGRHVYEDVTGTIVVLGCNSNASCEGSLTNPPPYIEIDSLTNPDLPSCAAVFNADADWSCDPYLAVFHVDDGAGNSCVVTVTE